MNCCELAGKIEALRPEATPRDVARLCLLLTTWVDDLDSLQDEARLTEAWQEIGWRLQAATDQHAAMAEELEALSQLNPDVFTSDQIWGLVRSIRVQSQVLQLYIGRSPACA